MIDPSHAAGDWKTSPRKRESAAMLRLRRGIIGLCLLAVLTRSAKATPPDEAPGARTFEMTYQVIVHDLPGGLP
jgi:hypothetical protein